MTRIVHLSDPHFGGEQPGALNAVAAFVAEQRPDVVVATGDLSLSGRRAELEAACAWLRGLGPPVVVTPGNHDVPYYSVGRLIDPFRRYREAAHGLHGECWRNADCVIATANTARGAQARANWALGAMSPRQSSAAAATMARFARPGALRVLATHHPLTWPEDAPIRGRTWGGRSAQRQLAGAAVDVFLSGHLHAAFARATPGGAVAVSAGTLSRRVRSEPCGFAMLEAEARTLTVTMLRIENGAAQAGAVRRFALA